MSYTPEQFNALPKHAQILITDLESYRTEENKDKVNQIIKNALSDDYNPDDGYDSDECGMMEDPMIRLQEHIKWAELPMQMHRNVSNDKYDS